MSFQYSLIYFCEVLEYEGFGKYADSWVTIYISHFVVQEWLHSKKIMTDGT